MKSTIRLMAALLVAASVVTSAQANHDRGNGKSQDHKKKPDHDTCRLSVIPFEFDPERTGTVTAAWVPGIGLPDAHGSDDHALLLEKTSPTSAPTAAVALVDGVEGLTLTELGFDISPDSYCSVGAPRFNVYTDEGVYYFFGCAHGTLSPVPGNPDWTRVRFEDEDAFPATEDVPEFPGFGNVTIFAIEIVMDEEGTAIIDNIDINGTLIGGPGIHECDDDDREKPGNNKNKDKHPGKTYGNSGK